MDRLKHKGLSTTSPPKPKRRGHQARRLEQWMLHCSFLSIFIDKNRPIHTQGLQHRSHRRHKPQHNNLEHWDSHCWFFRFLSIKTNKKWPTQAQGLEHNKPRSPRDEGIKPESLNNESCTCSFLSTFIDKNEQKSTHSNTRASTEKPSKAQASRGQPWAMRFAIFVFPQFYP